MKKVFFGLAVAVVALSASAFTSAKKNVAGTYLIQTSLGHWVLTNDVPDVENCSPEVTLQCFYEVKPEITLPEPTSGTTYVASEIEEFKTSAPGNPSEIVDGASSFPGIYTP